MILKFNVTFLLLSTICCEAPFQVHLKVPRYVLVKRSVTFKCEYNAPFDHIHKVEWLKGDRKLFHYVKGRNPPFYNFTIPGGKINWFQTNASQLTLENIDFKASGVYSCIVTTETPIYTKQSEEKHLMVVQLQTQNPKITFNRRKYAIGEWLEVNCTSGFAHPVPELTWLLNGNEVNSYSIKTFPEQSSYISTMQISFQIKEEHNSGFVLTCLSTIPGFMGKHVHHSQYADHRSDSIKIDVEGTEVIHNTSSRSLASNNKIIIILVAKLIYFM
ncbi:uncharacterized protein LOC135843923 [Planococcus citri]|uniref:uncharacterized protein LOC135843923 n=1 Tax=Planococcus citri TaxID=170843 RepID=UPI0031F8887C